MMKSFGLFLVSAFCVLSAFASEKTQSVVLNSPVEPRQLTGNFQVDFFGQHLLANGPQVQTETTSTEPQRKSSWLAAGLSLVVPGAGEFYAENYWKAALFLAVDVAAWGLAVHFDKKGDNQTSFFEGYANQHWSVVKYAEYSLDTFIPANLKSQYAGLIIPGTETRPPWERVNWNVLNRMESYIGSNVDNGKYYSHVLPAYGAQQYYELIGKYHEFNPGWDDAPPDWMYGQPVTANLSYYSVERGKANDYYTSATGYVTVALVNHVLSALDAAWTAHSYNRDIHASLQMQTVPTAYGYVQVPVARVEYSF